ncbi:hypothetical protein DNHGIG_00670 [Collibacillus ludicampi]|uniref:RNA polymerase sigma factor 70 region 4 type 2 domain-containing protein n=1 Tax=Collibacillus ludicampi TaxID=2771369 RepID=A0AAV4LA01_9BACL|nr:sigma-70 family RNA polymerase sigma factor [Collibacillus ludicampi]GIM44518.1 hypothetical protein DNHGIG_00670 [Collibacillus ludicampi]
MAQEYVFSKGYEQARVQFRRYVTTMRKMVVERKKQNNPVPLRERKRMIETLIDAWDQAFIDYKVKVWPPRYWLDVLYEVLDYNYAGSRNPRKLGQKNAYQTIRQEERMYETIYPYNPRYISSPLESPDDDEMNYDDEDDEKLVPAYAQRMGLFKFNYSSIDPRSIEKYSCESIVIVLEHYDELNYRAIWRGDHVALDILIDIRNALQQLTVKQRLCLELHYLHDYTFVDIAKKLGVSDEAVRKNTDAAIRKMSKILN